MLKLIGYIMFVMSFALWLLIPAIPLFELTAKQMAAWATGLFIAAEVLFWVSLLILGKEFWVKIKQSVSRFFGSKPSSEDSTLDV